MARAKSGTLKRIRRSVKRARRRVVGTLLGKPVAAPVETDPLADAIAAAETGIVGPREHGDDRELVRRIVRAYAAATERFAGHGASMWADINATAADLHRVLLGGDLEQSARLLRHPHLSNLFHGFDNPVGNEIAADMKQRIYLALRRLAEATGAVRLSNPETRIGTALSIDGYLDALDVRLGRRLVFPNLFEAEQGVRSARGIIGFRPLQALYQAWRLTRFGDGLRVLEIGAGLGRTAYYADLLGIADYTIVDIPLSNVAQADFLGRALGPDRVTLVGEEPESGGRRIRIWGPDFLATTDERFDVVLNVDSLTELDRDVARRYVDFAARRARVFVSINPEYHPQRVCDLLDAQARPHLTLRLPYWMREGYVEEIALFDVGLGLGG
jgi:hypothetical protein